MNIIIILILISLSLALIFLGAFFLAMRGGQFDDLESPSFKLLDKKEPKQLNHE